MPSATGYTGSCPDPHFNRSGALCSKSHLLTSESISSTSP